MSAKSSEPEEPDSYKLQMKDKGLLSFLWISGGKQIFFVTSLTTNHVIARPLSESPNCVCMVIICAYLGPRLFLLQLISLVDSKGYVLTKYRRNSIPCKLRTSKQSQ